LTTEIATELTAYKERCQRLPQPTEAQIAGFLSYVFEAHSWYKHLPAFPPGRTFQFYISPYAGCDTVVDSDGTPHFVERLGQDPLLHYSQLPTAEYRRRFGFLQYRTLAGTAVAGVDKDSRLRYPANDVALKPDRLGDGSVPRNVLAAGSVELTAVIHPDMAKPQNWRFHYKMLAALDEVVWPEESGGNRTVKQVREAYDAWLVGIYGLKANGFFDIPRENRVTDGFDPMASLAEIATGRLNEVLKPERNRLRHNAQAAIKRLLSVVYR